MRKSNFSSECSVSLIKFMRQGASHTLVGLIVDVGALVPLRNDGCVFMESQHRLIVDSTSQGRCVNGDNTEVDLDNKKIRIWL